MQPFNPALRFAPAPLAVLCGLYMLSCANSPSKPMQNPDPQATPTKEPQALASTLTLSDYHSLRTVEVQVGKEAMPFLWDTGGGITLFTPKVAQEMGCTPFGQLTGYRMRGEAVKFPRCNDASFRLGEVVFKAQTVGVFDLMALVPPGWEEIGGLIALSSFEDQPLTIDLANDKVIVENASTLAQRTQDMSPIDMKMVKQASGFSTVVLAKANSPGGELWIELDSGSTGPLILAPHAAKMLGVDLEDPAQAQRIDSDKGPTIWKVKNVTLDMGPAGKIDTPATVMDLIYDANMGAPLMARYLWTMDMQTNRLWVSPHTPPASKK